MNYSLSIAEWSQLPDREPIGVVAEGVELVVIRTDDDHVVFEGRCKHRGAKLSDGFVRGDDLICSLHNWDYTLTNGVSSYDSSECLHRFASERREDSIFVDPDEVTRFRRENALRVVPAEPTPRDEFDHHFAQQHHVPEEPYVGVIHDMAKGGLDKLGAHGPLAAMGVPRDDLPKWDDVQVLTAQLHRPPMLDDAPVSTSVTLGPRADRPLTLDIPIFVSDMSFGAISSEAKTALSRGAELAGTGICSGEGGMLPAEQAHNSKYLYELASGKFGWNRSNLDKVQAFHLKFGQGAKTGTGGHLPGHKVTAEIAEVRGLEAGQSAVSPARFPEFESPGDVADFLADLRPDAGGIPFGAKLSAQHIEADIDAALAAGVDYIILDGRGGGTGAAPLLFRDNISVPTMPAIARARRHLDAVGATDVTLVATGGIRTPADMVKVLALGADAIAVANVALQAIGCVGMRACHTDRCPVGIATQDPELRKRLPVDDASERLGNYLASATHLISVLVRACGYDDVGDLQLADLTTFNRDIAALAGIPYGGVLQP